MSLVENTQLKLLKEIKNFFSINKKFKNLISRLDYYYLCPYDNSKGTSRLIFFFNKFLSIKIYLIATFRDIYKILKIGKFKILNYNQNKKYNTIVFNWGKNSDFDKKGNFYDKHFNVKSSYCPNILWVVIFLDKNIPRYIGKNIILIYNERKIFNLKNLFKIIFIAVFKNKNFNFLNQELSFLTILSNFFLSNTNILLNNKIKKVIMPYEGQPFQNSIFNCVHNYSKNIKTIGYVHSFPSGLPSNYFKRSGSPRKIIVSGDAQKFCFHSHLGWNKNEIKVLPSSRYLKNKIDMKNKIFLPINFNSKTKILSSIKKIAESQKLNLKNFEIKNHPHTSGSKKHESIIFDLRKIIINYSNSSKIKKTNVSIFIGPTASVIEALERNSTVFHICEIPELESYNKKIWKYISSSSIDRNIFKYKLEKKNKLIKFGKNVNLYKSYLQ